MNAPSQSTIVMSSLPYFRYDDSVARTSSSSRAILSFLRKAAIFSPNMDRYTSGSPV